MSFDITIDGTTYPDCEVTHRSINPDGPAASVTVRNKHGFKHSFTLTTADLAAGVQASATAQAKSVSPAELLLILKETMQGGAIEAAQRLGVNVE
jgi:hypothetical protein